MDWSIDCSSYRTQCFLYSTSLVGQHLQTFQDCLEFPTWPEIPSEFCQPGNGSGAHRLRARITQQSRKGTLWSVQTFKLSPFKSKQVSTILCVIENSPGLYRVYFTVHRTVTSFSCSNSQKISWKTGPPSISATNFGTGKTIWIWIRKSHRFQLSAMKYYRNLWKTSVCHA